MNNFNYSNQIIIGSSNKGKVEEFKKFFINSSFNLMPLPMKLDIEENGSNFVENARIKSVQISKILPDYLILSDDSGLCVDALNGAPGIFSARYAPNDEEKVSKLLKEMKSVVNREARFKCALCLVFNEKIIAEVEGTCRGKIGIEPKGRGGFGYDPVFEVLDKGITFAEMSYDEKRLYGHRGKAFEHLLPILKKIFDKKFN